MKPQWLLMGLGFLAAAATAQSQGLQKEIYRCGNEYTNTKPAGAGNKDCKLVEGGNITVIPSLPTAKSSNAGAAKVDLAQQAEREAERRQILQDELNQALARKEQLTQEYNNGEPEKQGSETLNYQKYLDRVAEIKASIERNDSDIASLQREIERLPNSNATPAPAQ